VAWSGLCCFPTTAREIGSGCYANEGDRVSAVCRFVERGTLVQRPLAETDNSMKKKEVYSAVNACVCGCE
jgi:hypothetical protein